MNSSIKKRWCWALDGSYNRYLGHLASDVINSNIVQKIAHIFLEEFKKMASLAILTRIARSTNEAHILVGHPLKFESYTMSFRVHSRYETQQDNHV